MGRIKAIIKHVPLYSRVFFCLLPIAVMLHLSFIFSESFAELYLRTAGRLIRSVLAWITNPFPMSLAEAFLLFSPFVLVSLIILAVKTGGEFPTSVRLISGILSVITLVYSIFSFTFAAGFYVRDVGEYFGIERRSITVDELYSAALLVVEGVNETYGELDGKGPGSTSMGMSLDEMNGELLESFSKLYDEYGYPSKLTSRIKPVVLSEPMTYTHISGVYTFFTGEANVNVNFPDFVIPYTAAHELSHQRGVSREDEANFVAFLVCISSDDPYIRYSGYLNMYQYMASALGGASYDMYAKLADQLDIGVNVELSAYSVFFDKYRDNKAAEFSDNVNDTYLSIMSGNDSRSYGMVVDLATVYLNER